MTKPTPLKDIAARIDAHLKRFERDPVINKNTKPDGSGLSDYYQAHAYVGGRWVRVRYISFQGTSSLSRDQAERYLAKLDAGFVGRHFEALRDA